MHIQDQNVRHHGLGGSAGRAAALLSAVLITGSAWANDAAHAVSSRALLESHVAYLASDELGGRGVGAPGVDLAADYIAARFAEYGLVPAGDDGGYRQAFEIPILKQSTEHCTLRVQGGSSVTCTLRRDFTLLPSSSAGSFDGNVVFVGYGIHDPESGYDDYAGLNVQGKIALMLRYEPPDLGRAAGGRASRHALFRTKAQVAKDRGAQAVIIVNPPDREDTLLSDRIQDGGIIPMFHITRQLADTLLAAGGAPPIAELHQSIIRDHRPRSVELTGVRVQGNPGLDASAVTASNIVGLLPGSGPLAGEYLVIGGHYDHLGTVPPTRRPRVGGGFDQAEARIHNGADDNASGISALLELARQYAIGGAPRRSLLFIAFTAEEMGLLGSRHFVENPSVPLDRVVAMFNLDMIGRLYNMPLTIYGADSALEFNGLIDRHTPGTGLEVQKIAAPGAPSDHASFSQKNIPVLFLFSGMHEDYHRPSDDADKIDYDGITRIVKLLKGIADDVLAADQRPTQQRVSPPVADMIRRMPVRLGVYPAYQDSGDLPGLGVQQVVSGGPAESAGMVDGDRILQIESRAVGTVRDLRQALSGQRPGDVIAVQVQRDGKALTLKVTLAPG